MAKKKKLTVEDFAVIILAYVTAKWPSRRPWSRAIRAIARDVGRGWVPNPAPTAEQVAAARDLLEEILSACRGQEFRFQWAGSETNPVLARAEDRYNAAVAVWTDRDSRQALRATSFDVARREHVLLSVLPSRLLCEKSIYDAVRASSQREDAQQDNDPYTALLAALERVK